MQTQHFLVEGAAGVALGAFLKAAKSSESQKFQGKNHVVVLSGANMSLETLKSILALNGR